MATPLDDSQSTPTAWTDWQAMRFLYQDINSLLYGGGLDLSGGRFNIGGEFGLPQFTLPALNLTNYFNTFSLIQGQGSINSGAGTTNQGGGGSIVLPCDLCNFATMPASGLANYIVSQGAFSLSNFQSSILSMQTAALNVPFIYGSVTDPNPLLGVVLSPDVSLSFSVDICPPHNCSNINSLSLIFSSDAIVYVWQNNDPVTNQPVLRLYALWNFNYTLKASIGLGVSFLQSPFPYSGAPVFDVTLSKQLRYPSFTNTTGVSWGGQVPLWSSVDGSYNVDIVNLWKQGLATLLDSASLNYAHPTLQQGFNNILLQAPCSC